MPIDNDTSPTPEQWKAEGEARLLIRSLERKFGPLDDPTKALIYSMDADTLLDGIERLAVAHSISEVLATLNQPDRDDLEEEEETIVVDADYPSVVRTKKGLAIAGTRLTLYDVMDCLRQQWSSGRIQQWFRLTTPQMNEVVDFIQKYRDEVEADYRQVLEYVEEKRQYWQDRHRHWTASTPSATGGKPGRQEFWTTLRRKQMERREE